MDESEFNQIDKIKILSRLKRIEGQIRGIQKMIIDERPCSDIMIQVTAIKSALNQVSKLILENHVNSWYKLTNNSEDYSQDMVSEMIDLILKYIK